MEPLVDGAAIKKHAIVQPLIKKHNLDPSVLSSFKPISKLPFLSKVLEKGVLEQVQLHLDLNGITEKFQSGLISRHSIATALLKIFNDLLLSVDSGSPAALRLLDFTAAFYTVDHQIILSRLELCVDITGNVLKWFKSYLSERTFSVHLGQYSAAAPLACGVPQGSILAPILFALYLLPLGSIFEKLNISFHCFADDLQVYLPLKSNKDSTNALLNCLID